MVKAVDKPFEATFMINDPETDFYPFVEVASLKSVTVKLLRVWENVTPSGEVDKDPEDGSYILDNTHNDDLEHFFANEIDATYELKLNED